MSLFLALAGGLGIVGANFVSTSAGMAFSFVVNGLFTFGAGRLTLRHAALFLSTTGAVMWLVQPAVIHALVALADAGGLESRATSVLLVAKLVSIGVSLGANFVAYRFVVWPHARRD